jgi:hypothetical protein
MGAKVRTGVTQTDGTAWGEIGEEEVWEVRDRQRHIKVKQ